MIWLARTRFYGKLPHETPGPDTGFCRRGSAVHARVRHSTCMPTRAAFGDRTVSGENWNHQLPGGQRRAFPFARLHYHQRAAETGLVVSALIGKWVF